MNLGAWLVSLAGPAIRQVLLSLGIGTITYIGLDAAITGALVAAKGSMATLTGSSIQVLAMGGVFTSMSIIAGGITAAVSIVVLKRFAKL